MHGWTVPVRVLILVTLKSIQLQQYPQPYPQGLSRPSDIALLVRPRSSLENLVFSLTS